MKNGFTQEERQHWMGILAAAPLAELESAWERLSTRPEYEYLRKPETGMVMVRGRADGNGGAFNFAEVPVTRCTVRIVGGPAGCAHVKGTVLRHAELAAVMDALLQGAGTGEEVRQKAIIPLENGRLARKRKTATKTDATKVDFFTMVRGE